MHRLLNHNSVRLNPNLFRHALAAQKHCFSTNLEAEKNLPTHAQAVIVGGGVIGSSLAYHLTNMGWKDVHLLEQNQATSGTTWHAAGLVGTSRATSTETKLSMRGAELYERLEEETGLNAGFKRCGSLTVARTKERLEALERNAARSRAFGLPAEIVGPAECGKL
jgi:glycine/D-amino acid oxidase-like deaminating enzyme